MKRVALKIAYIGTNFHGFQRQPNHRTVEGEIIYVLKNLGYIDDLEKSKFRIAGRTDRGVHSLGNVVSFMSEREVIINQINHKLPQDIQIIAKAPVRYGFKPRYSMSKHYRYIFFEKNMNIQAMKDVARIFIGEHDFTNFSKKDQKTPVRKIDNIKITPEDSTTSSYEYSQKSEDNPYSLASSKYDTDLKDSGEFLKTNYLGELKAIGRFNKNFNNIKFNNDSYDSIYIDVYGESFLWNMIRKMARVFLWVGKNELEVEKVKDMLNPNKKYNIKPLNPENLILMDIEYDNIKFQYDDYAFEGFKRTLLENLFDYKLKLSIENSILNSMESLKNKDFNRK